MIRKNTFGGCSPRLNASQCDDKFIYFCSSSNVLISDSVEVKQVHFLENQLNFLNVKNNRILAGDVAGCVYLIDNNSISRFGLGQNIQNGMLLSEGDFLFVTFTSVHLYDYMNKIMLNSFETQEIISSCCAIDDYVFIGTSEGNIFLFDIKLTMINKFSGHLDRIQGMSTTIIDSVVYVAKCSKDNAIKIWAVKEISLNHVQTLNGHSDWVSSVYWCKDNRLISSSFDRSIVIWTRNNENLWTNSFIYGGYKAFYNAFEYCDVVYGQSASGGFYKFKDGLCNFISGHTEEVTSLDWQDSFLLTTSLDKTSRIFLGNREIIRPQNHGHPIQVAKFLDKKSLSIISGAQETIIRTLEPTYVAFMNIRSNESIHNFLVSEDTIYKNTINEFEPLRLEETETMKIAAVPAELSLTNDVLEDYDYEGLSEHLLSSTTFNEIKKIYGHYFDISTIDVSRDYITSANKALTRKFSGVFLWNKNYEIVEYLEVHNSTINRLRFSPNGRYICSVSNDKTSTLLEISNGLKVKYTNVDHTRAVWDCSFSYDSKYYATCSRDKNVHIYEVCDNTKCFSQQMDEEVTSIDFSPIKHELLIGLVSGNIRRLVFANNQFCLDTTFKVRANGKKINMLRYNRNGRYAASCGSDWLVSVFEIQN